MEVLSCVHDATPVSHLCCRITLSALKVMPVFISGAPQVSPGWLAQHCGTLGQKTGPVQAFSLLSFMKQGYITRDIEFP
jgi:hypothetical protein